MTYTVHPLRPYMRRVNFDPTDDSRRESVLASFQLAPVQLTAEGLAHLAEFHDMERIGQTVRHTADFVYCITR